MSKPLDGERMRNAAVPEEPRAPLRGSIVVERASGQPRWDEDVVEDIAGLDYVRAVVFSDGRGLLVHRHGRSELARDLAEQLDMSLAAQEQTGLAMAMGELQVGVSIFESGMVVSGSARGLRVSVLADGTANLGQLLSQVRRVFVSAHG